MKILVTLPLTDAQVNRVRAAAGDAAVVLAADRGDQRREIQDADVLFGHMTPELLEFAPHVRWVQQTGAGVDGSLFPAFVESDIVFTSEKGLRRYAPRRPRDGPVAWRWRGASPGLSASRRGTTGCLFAPRPGS